MAPPQEAKARELITELQIHQKKQIECLESLFGLTQRPEKQQARCDDEPADSSKDSDSDIRPVDPRLPEQWTQLWSDELLLRRIEERQRKPGCGESHSSRLVDISADDEAFKYILSHILRSVSDFTTADQDVSPKAPPFHILDYNQDGEITLDTDDWRLMSTNAAAKGQMQERLQDNRNARDSLSRAIFIRDFTPSALAAVFLSAARDDSIDFTSMFATVRRHLSVLPIDRHFNEGHERTMFADLAETQKMSVHIYSFTIPYFKITEAPPLQTSNPLSPYGFFGVDKNPGKYIREEKLSFTWLGGRDQPSLLLVLNPDAADHHLVPDPGLWLRNSFFNIDRAWQAVLDALDDQTTIPSSIAFNNDLRYGILFEDQNFSNSKRYFWALQSLRLFAEHIDGTLRSLPNVFYSLEVASGFPDLKAMRVREETVRTWFETSRARIERKRLEIQSLSDGLFSASSVAESRISREQNSNIRLLTLITIAYLPLSLSASVYSMRPLPDSANLVSYIIVTLLMSLITYALVFNVQKVEAATSLGRRAFENSVDFMRRLGRRAEQGKQQQPSCTNTKRSDSLA